MKGLKTCGSNYQKLIEGIQKDKKLLLLLNPANGLDVEAVGNRVRSTLKVAHKKGKYSKEYKSTTPWPETKNLSDKDSTNVLEAHAQSERKNRALWNEIKEMAAECCGEDVILKPGTSVDSLEDLEKIAKRFTFFSSL